MNPIFIILAMLAFWEISAVTSLDSFRIANCDDDFSALPALNEGDLVFRRGKSIESYVVLAADGSVRYSHIGIAHIKEDSGCVILHAVPAENKADNTVKMEPLKAFWHYKNASAGAIFRIKLNASQKEKISGYIDRVHNARVEFDDAYDLHDSSKLYCTELVRNAYRGCGIDILAGNMDSLIFPRRIPIIFPGTILKNSKIQHIYSFPNN
ncbi:hypothetical protein L21SP5_01430 [Salinivirga cyanobacteriivorans]|uniref:Permuted papain-like amidase YaeF/Yiix C92 family enzyme n=1 Tax=Salinivirga cyanobacteriivorans TaxID=1307839 RepID=A0A0S2HYH6_9BACT|nr:YiiX/YebB-like N1pC/P60 family cysteine hydrolase [Salinivirga cyanobacteriivorans]ALO15080.1 hypothetical protein L21SP5_01430 [Salinivirga cyanobacteriivorans]